KAISAGKKVEHYPIKDYWMAVDLLSDMEEANKELTSGKLKEWIAKLKAANPETPFSEKI
ncbi:hypothetical protein HZB03_01830, partial [Candidatus Woesearchaeota archaeon]|nr:hypothetical protein [Candidatus Woesearchaeota archaeon]